MDLKHPANCLTFNLQRATRGLTREFETALKAVGLTSPQFSTLSQIAGHGEVTITHLAERLGTDRTTMTRNLDLLARKGWVAEADTEDGRLRVLRLTDEGRRVLGLALPVWAEVQAQMVKSLGEDTARDLLTALNKI